jgi:phage shock protein PspC (stress-responsive transcriptional regulator)
MRYQGHYSAQQHLVKQSRGKVFTGVCSGVAKYYKLSTVGLRAASVFAFMFFPLATASAYLLASLILPSEK